MQDHPEERDGTAVPHDMPARDVSSLHKAAVQAAGEKMSDGITDGMSGMKINGRCKIDWRRYGWHCQWLLGDHDCTAFRHSHCPFTPNMLEPL